MKRRIHDPEAKAAAYVNGAMPARATRRFEAHLLSCEACWREVQLEREGRRVAERGRELAPAALRDHVRGLVTVSAGAGVAARNQRRILVLASLIVAGLVAAVGATLLVRHSGSQPAEISAATAAYRSGPRVDGPATHTAPDLSTVGLGLVASGRARLAGAVVDVFTYNAGSGTTVSLFVSPTSFPQAAGASETGAGMAAGWSAHVDGLSLYCGSRPVNYLLVAADQPHLEQVQAVLPAQLTLVS